MKSKHFPVTPQTLLKYFEKYGWMCRIDTGDVCHSGWTSKVQSFSLKVRINRTFIMFEAQLFSFGKNMNRTLRHEVLDFLAYLNQSATMVRLSISQENIVCLHVDVLIEGFSLSQHHTILGIIGYYADELYQKFVQKKVEIDRRLRNIKLLYGQHKSH